MTINAITCDWLRFSLNKKVPLGVMDWPTPGYVTLGPLNLLLVAKF